MKSVETLDKAGYSIRKKKHVLVRANGLDFTMTTDVNNRTAL